MMGVVPANVLDTPALDTSAASHSAHLRALVEKQPVCLLRAALDGTLLAVNDAGLSFLGACDLGQLLGTSMTGRLLQDREPVWREFSARVWEIGSDSRECDLTDLSGHRRRILLQAVACPDHPDGMDSLFLTFRDAGSPERLESTVREMERLRAVLEVTERQLTDARAERERLASALSQAECERWRLSGLLVSPAASEGGAEADAELAGRIERLQAELAEAHERNAALERDAREHAAARQELRSEFERALEARDAESSALIDRLVRQLEHHKEAARRLQTAEAELAAARDEVARQRADATQALEAAFQRGVDARQQQVLPILDSLRQQLDEALSDQRRLQASLQQSAEAHAQKAGELMAERVQTELALLDVESKRARLLKALADERRGTQALRDIVRALSGLAADAEIARDAAARIQQALAAAAEHAPQADVPRAHAHAYGTEDV